MDITALEGMDLVSLVWSSNRFQLRAIDSGGRLWEATLTNPNQAPVGVTVRSLSLRLIYDSELGAPTLGELETITVQGSEILFEADAGDFSVRAERVFVQEIKGADRGSAA